MWQSRPMKLLVVDDHPLFRDGLAALLRQANPDTQVFQACDSEAGVELAQATADLDAVFVDLMMPGIAGEAAVKEFARRRPELPVIVLSSSENPSDVKRVLNAGALGYIPKSATPEILILALRLVLARGVYLPPAVLDGGRAAAAPEAASPGSTAALPGLTPRQMDVLRCVIQGKPNKLIARELEVSEHTVKAHLSSVLRALDARSRTEAVYAAAKMGLRLA